MYVSDCIQIIILGYALGSIPFGVLLAKLFRLPDPRYIGSGNIGATNMLRTGRKDIALLTLLLDAGKGVAAVMITNYLFPLRVPSPIMDCDIANNAACWIAVSNPHYAALAVLAAAIGHMYTPWLKFKGGKGMATILGGTLAFSWPVGLAALMVWLLTCFTIRYVSLASIAALSIIPLVTWLRIDVASALILAIASATAIWRHRGNIDRLRKGFEPKVSFGKGEK